MAEVLYNVAAGLILSLGSSAVNEIGLWLGVSDELDKLRETVGTIEAVLLHAEEQSVHNPQVKHWLGLLTEAFYDADDLLDEFSYEALRQQVMDGPEISKKVRLFFSSSNKFVFGRKMGHKVRALRERLAEIAAEKNNFHLEERSVVERRFVSNGRDQTHSYPPEVVIGREQEKGEIVELLLSSSDRDENVSVVSIVGIGGLGKTTLAQMVYNDERVKNHFELKIWVCVSDEFDVKLLVRKVLESLTKEAPKTAEMDPLKDLLHEKINGRKYLLMLDDVWNDDLQKWNNFKDLLAGGARGSKIVITTRLRKVSETGRSISMHELRGLSEKESWSLFEKVAFKQDQLPNPRLEALGKETVAKCCGVPLAIKTIAGMLYFKDSECEWLLFKDKELSAIDVYKNDILPILKLSYNHLPSHYKRCFAYCSLYPKDFRIPVQELIQLWKAQGYIKADNADESLRDVGFEYFMNLFRLSFFQDVEKDEFGNIKFCKMHDLMHDLAVSVAGDNYFASHSGNVLFQNKTQHMSFSVYHYSLSQYMSSLLKAKKIRTVLRLYCGYNVKIIEKEVDGVFCNLKCLRVLNLSNMSVHALPNSIYKLKHLRYLNLSINDKLKKLPNSIGRLQNLQVLKLEWCKNLEQLPSNITKLVNLTDLDNSGCDRLSYMPRGIGKLTRLELLSEFIIAEEELSMRKRSGGIDELHSLNNLKGELAIKNLRYVKNAEAANLSAKKQLELLTLDWIRCSPFITGSFSYDENEVGNDEMRLEALCPHPNLKALTVLCYGGVKPPSWLPSLSNLMRICFSKCKRIQRLPPFDHLPHLKELEVYELTALESMEVENGRGSLAFPSLTQLCLVECPKLRGFERQSTEELPFFPRLSYLRITSCPNLATLPLFPKLETLASDGLKSLMEIAKQADSASESTSSPFSVFSHLKYLQIENMEDSPMDELLQYLPSLQHLVFLICSCRTVCRDMDDGMHWQCLKVLCSVKFQNMKNLVSLPKGLQYVTTLQTLVIWDCPRLACIPEWMPKLTALQHLTIGGSPQLEERCKDSTAEDRPYISHIPNIQIGGKYIQRNGCYLI